MDAYEILVVFLSITLAVLLVLSIVLVVYLIKISKNISSITEKADDFASDIQEAGETLKKSATSMAAGKMIVSIIEWVRARNGGSKDE